MMTIAFKGNHFERDVILWGVRWYVAYPLSYRQIEEMMEERGVEVDHSTLNRWVLKDRCWGSRPSGQRQSPSRVSRSCT
jgi:transposase-like protein